VNSPPDLLNLRQSVVDLLEADPPQEERLLADFERDAEAVGDRDTAHPLYSTIIYILTHLTFSEPEARRHWQRIVAHRARLRVQLGREVGLRVALLDYFLNVNRELKNPKVIEISIFEKTERSAVTDGLTSLYNHSYFLQSLRREVLRAKRHGLKMSLIMFDLDNFKKVNDRYGHVEGDQVLLRAATLMVETLREIDIAARYGGEEFGVLLPDTPRNGAYVVADRIRRRIEDHFRRRKLTADVTISGGVAVYPDDADSPETLLRTADEALYRSKALGKNRVTLAGGERRRFMRIPASHRITLLPAGGRRTAARAKNVSEGGLLLGIRLPVPVGSRVNLLIRPPRAEAVAFRGEVVRVTEVAGSDGTRFDVAVRLFNDAGKAKALILRRMAASAVHP
jgi:diguanylate cyclase (GGDEF)-like protein